jgi:hypothetical protein
MGVTVRDAVIFFALLAAIALPPGIPVACMRNARLRPLWVRGLIVLGVGVGLLPVALWLTLIIMFQVLGIDMMD